MSATATLLVYCLGATGIFEITQESHTKATKGYEDKPNLQDLSAFTTLAVLDRLKGEKRYFLLPNAPSSVRDEALRLKREVDVEAEGPPE